MKNEKVFLASMLFCEMIHSSLKMTSNILFCSSCIGKRIHTYIVEAYLQNTNYTLALCCRILFSKSPVYSIPSELNLCCDVYKCYLQNHRSIKIMLKHVLMYVLPLTEIFFQPLFYVPILLR